ncbi:MAG: TIM-barrel domain-containing protein [Acidobacteriota bacterium]
MTAKKKGWVWAGIAATGLLTAIFLGRPGGPPIAVTGAPVQVEVSISPFKVRLIGEARIERIDEFRVRLTSPSGDIRIKLAEGEAVYGLMERIVDDYSTSENVPAEVGQLDRRGQRVTMWVQPTIAAYAPFYMSSRGYGMWVEGTRPGIYDIGKRASDELRLEWDVGNRGFSGVFILGPGLTDILDRYTRMSGRPVRVPRWFFRPLKWRDRHRSGEHAVLDGLEVNADLAEDILMYEKLGFPAGTYLFDRPWAQGEKGYGNFTWNEERFPNGDAMVGKLHDRGWRVIVWGSPWALGKQEWEFGPEAERLGYKISDRSLDYTNPAAVAWHRKKIEGFVARSGIDGWKLDRSEEDNPSTKQDLYFDGRTGFEVHNDYPRLFIRTFYDATRAVRGDDFVLMSRAAFGGSQQWGVVWGGDSRGSVRTFRGWRSTDKGLRSVILSLQHMALMGYPVWGSDTGGYQGFSDREVFARWLEVSCFSPIMEIGGTGSHEPWKMPTEPSYDQEMIEIFRRYTWIHARLAEYTYKLSERASATGNPIVHPLVLDWPDDPAVRGLWDEYMYGPSLLVAPVWRSGARERPVYLPPGEWIDLWDPGRIYRGPVTIQVQVPLDRIAVFIKADEKHRLPANLLQGP